LYLTRCPDFPHRRVGVARVADGLQSIVVVEESNAHAEQAFAEGEYPEEACGFLEDKRVEVIDHEHDPRAYSQDDRYTPSGSE